MKGSGTSLSLSKKANSSTLKKKGGGWGAGKNVALTRKVCKGHRGHWVQYLKKENVFSTVKWHAPRKLMGLKTKKWAEWKKKGAKKNKNRNAPERRKSTYSIRTFLSPPHLFKKRKTDHLSMALLRGMRGCAPCSQNALH